MRSFRMVLALVTLASVFVVGGPAKEAAAVTCDTPAANFHNATIRDQGTVKKWTGIRGAHEVRDALACTASPTIGPVGSLFTFGLGDSDSSSVYFGALAQAGVIHNSEEGGCDCLRFFWEWTPLGGGPFHRFVGQSPAGNPIEGQTYFFKVEKVWPTGHLRMLYDYNQDGTYETMPVNSSGVSAETSYDPNDYWSYVAPFVGEEIIYEPSNYMGTGPTEAATVDQGFIRQPLQSGTWVSADWVSQESKWRGSFEAGGVHTFAADGKAAFYQGTCPPTCKEKVTGS